MFCCIVLSSGCSASSAKVAVIVDGIGVSPRTIPVIKNDFVFELDAIDGLPIKRENTFFQIDAYAGAEAAPGSHIFKVLVYPIARPPNYVPKSIEFSATVQPDKRYAITGNENTPSLIEYHQQ